jgi:hypothetical protein
MTIVNEDIQRRTKLVIVSVLEETVAVLQVKVVVLQKARGKDVSSSTLNVTLKSEEAKDSLF